MMTASHERQLFIISTFQHCIKDKPRASKDSWMVRDRGFLTLIREKSELRVAMLPLPTPLVSPECMAESLALALRC